MFGRRKLGWKPNPPDINDWDFNRLELSTEGAPPTKSLRHNVSNVLDQRNTSSCVAHSLAGAIDVLETRAGLSYVPPSRLFIYYNARKFHSKILIDAGTYIRTAVKGMVKFGVPDEGYWKFSTNPININRRPRWKAQNMAWARRGGEYYAIKSVGGKRCDEIKQAISNGYPVAFGTGVDKGFMDSDGLPIVDVPESKSKIVGGHAMLIVGYSDAQDGLLFEVLNSWGSDWRSHGYIWMTSDYIEWSRTRDLTIVKGWDRLRNAEE